MRNRIGGSVPSAAIILFRKRSKSQSRYVLHHTHIGVRKFDLLGVQELPAEVVTYDAHTSTDEVSAIDLDSTAGKIEVGSTSAESNLAAVVQDEADWDENFVIDDIFNAILHGDLQPEVRTIADAQNLLFRTCD